MIKLHEISSLYYPENQPEQLKDLCQHPISYLEYTLNELPVRFKTQTMEDLYGFPDVTMIPSNVARTYR